jgi:hypothetical protein
MMSKVYWESKGNREIREKSGLRKELRTRENRENEEYRVNGE